MYYIWFKLDLIIITNSIEKNRQSKSCFEGRAQISPQWSQPPPPLQEGPLTSQTAAAYVFPPPDAAHPVHRLLLTAGWHPPSPVGPSPPLIRGPPLPPLGD